MSVRPRLTPLTLAEAAYMLQGLYLADLSQLQRGYPGILAALRKGSAGPGRRRLRYNRDDPDEQWRTIRDIWQRGGGDCEDLAAAVAAELTHAGIAARPVIYRVRRGLAHAVVQLLATGQIIDPSRIGGMGEVDPWRVGDIAVADNGQAQVGERVWIMRGTIGELVADCLASSGCPYPREAA